MSMAPGSARSPNASRGSSADRNRDRGPSPRRRVARPLPPARPLRHQRRRCHPRQDQRAWLPKPDRGTNFQHLIEQSRRELSRRIDPRPPETRHALATDRAPPPPCKARRKALQRLRVLAWIGGLLVAIGGNSCPVRLGVEMARNRFAGKSITSPNVPKPKSSASRARGSRLPRPDPRVAPPLFCRAPHGRKTAPSLTERTRIRRLQDSIDLTPLRTEADAIEVKVASGAISGPFTWIHHKPVARPGRIRSHHLPRPRSVTPPSPRLPRVLWRDDRCPGPEPHFFAVLFNCWEGLTTYPARPCSTCGPRSGSSGNSALVCHEDTRILVDAGLSARQLCERLNALGVEPDSLSAIVLTHEQRRPHPRARGLLPEAPDPHLRHPPHRPNRPGRPRALLWPGGNFEAGNSFRVGGVEIHSFPVPTRCRGSRRVPLRMRTHRPRDPQRRRPRHPAHP